MPVSDVWYAFSWMKTQLQDREREFWVQRKVKRSKTDRQTDRQQEEAGTWLCWGVKTNDGAKLFKGTALLYFTVVGIFIASN